MPGGGIRGSAGLRNRRTRQALPDCASSSVPWLSPAALARRPDLNCRFRSALFQLCYLAVARVAGLEPLNLVILDELQANLLLILRILVAHGEDLVMRADVLLRV